MWDLAKLSSEESEGSETGISNKENEDMLMKRYKVLDEKNFF